MHLSEFEHIVEFSYHEKTQFFVIRFLDGSSYSLGVGNLPKKLQTKKPDWERAAIAEDKGSILVTAGSDLRQIPAHVIHSRGTLI